MSNVLIAAYGAESVDYVRRSMSKGFQVSVLDCFEDYHNRLAALHSGRLLQVHGHRSEVTEAVRSCNFDIAIVHEYADFVRTALVTQSLREAGVKMVVVVTPDRERRIFYRKFGAHRTVLATTPDDTWMDILKCLPLHAVV